MPSDGNDERLCIRFKTFLDAGVWVAYVGTTHEFTTSQEPPQEVVLFEEEDLQKRWIQAQQADQTYQRLSIAVRKGMQKLVEEAKIKTSLAKCRLNENGLLRFRDRIWILEDETLWTSIIQKTHDSHLTGHPGQNLTYGLLAQ